MPPLPPPQTLSAASFLPPGATTPEAPQEVTWPGVKREIEELWDKAGEYSLGYQLMEGIGGLWQATHDPLDPRRRPSPEEERERQKGQQDPVPTQKPRTPETEKEWQDFRDRLRKRTNDNTQLSQGIGGVVAPDKGEWELQPPMDPLVTPIHEPEAYVESFPAKEDENVTYDTPAADPMDPVPGFGDIETPTFEEFIYRAVKPQGGNWAPEYESKDPKINPILSEIDIFVSKVGTGELAGAEFLPIGVSLRGTRKVGGTINIGAWTLDTAAERLRMLDQLLSIPEDRFYETYSDTPQTGHGRLTSHKTREALKAQRDLVYPLAKMEYWANTVLPKYIKNYVGTATDPVLQQANELGTLPYDSTGQLYKYNPDPTAEWRWYGRWYGRNTLSNGNKFDDFERRWLGNKRAAAGYPREGEYRAWDAYGELEKPLPTNSEKDVRAMRNRKQAQLWETITDAAVETEDTVGDYINEELLDTPNSPPWMQKVDPKTPLYSLKYPNLSFNRMGFDLMLRELQTGANPTANLPDNLRISPKDFERMSVPHAVKKAHKISKWRFESTRKLLEERAKANLAETPYLAIPEQGVSWIRIPDVTSSQENMCLATGIGATMDTCIKSEAGATAHGSDTSRLHALIDAKSGAPLMQIQVTTPRGSRDQRISQVQLPGNNIDWESTRLQTYISRDPNYREKMRQSLYQFILNGNTQEASEVVRGSPFTSIGFAGSGTPALEAFGIRDLLEEEMALTQDLLDADKKQVLEKWLSEGKIDSVTNYDPEKRYVLDPDWSEKKFAHGGFVTNNLSAADFLPKGQYA